MEKVECGGGAEGQEFSTVEAGTFYVIKIYRTCLDTHQAASVPTPPPVIHSAAIFQGRNFICVLRQKSGALWSHLEERWDKKIFPRKLAGA